MNAIVKHIVEIAGGVAIGLLASDAVDKVVETTKKKVVELKAKETK